jgi:hypothetical protein
MFTKILIANRGDQPHSGTVAQPNCLMHAVHAGDLSAMEVQHVS